MKTMSYCLVCVSTLIIIYAVSSIYLLSKIWQVGASAMFEWNFACTKELFIFFFLKYLFACCSRNVGQVTNPLSTKVSSSLCVYVWRILRLVTSTRNLIILCLLFFWQRGGNRSHRKAQGKEKGKNEMVKKKYNKERDC